MEWADEILITKSDLSEKNALVGELQRRVEELQMANEYQLRLKDMNHNERLKELTDKFVQEKEELKRQLQQTRTEREKEAARFDEEMATAHDHNLAEVQDVEHRHNQRLMAEFEKYQELQKTSQAMQERYEGQLQAMEQAKAKALKELADFWEVCLVPFCPGGPGPRGQRKKDRAWRAPMLTRRLAVALRLEQIAPAQRAAGCGQRCCTPTASGIG